MAWAGRSGLGRGGVGGDECAWAGRSARVSRMSLRLGVGTGGREECGGAVALSLTAAWSSAEVPEEKN